MGERLASWWFTVRDTLWPIPAAMTTAAVLLALLLVQVDKRVLSESGEAPWWLFSGGAAGARGVLTTIAGTSMTIATTAFSITIVALQLGSSQFSPRILRGFTGDRGNQVVLGIFVATFAYALVVLRVVRTETDDQHTFVPGTAVTFALLLAFVMIGALIYFFHHATRSIQAPVIIDRAVQDTRGLIEAEIGRRETMTLQSGLAGTSSATIWIESESAGYLQNIDLGLLVQSARDMGGMIQVLLEEGAHVLPGTALASVLSMGSQADEDALAEPCNAHDETESRKAELEQRVETIRSAFLIGMERTLEHDVELGFRQVSDIALKALSPGINDPTTATICIDRLAELLDLALEMAPGIYGIRDEGDQVRVLADLDGFDVYLASAFDQIRHYGAGDVTVMLHLLGTLEKLSRKSGDSANRQLLMAMAERAVEETREQSLPQADRARILAAAMWAMPIAA